jgi:hypothetical protein
VADPAKQLANARMKLQRAEEHFQELMTSHATFTDPDTRNPYRMLPEFGDKPNETIWRAKITDPPPLEKWGAMVGDCIHCLRSALDHVAYELVRINRPTSDYSEFPICKERDRWRIDRPKKLPDVPARALAQVQRAQPYKRGADARYHPLWVIHALDIMDKHRRLNIVSPMVRAVQLLTRDCTVIHDERFAGPFEDGTKINSHQVVPTGPNVQVQAVFAFDITFGEGELLQGEPVIQKLYELRAVTAASVSRFDQYFS